MTRHERECSQSGVRRQVWGRTSTEEKRRRRGSGASDENDSFAVTQPKAEGIRGDSGGPTPRGSVTPPLLFLTGGGVYCLVSPPGIRGRVLTRPLVVRLHIILCSLGAQSLLGEGEPLPLRSRTSCPKVIKDSVRAEAQN